MVFPDPLHKNKVYNVSRYFETRSLKMNALLILQFVSFWLNFANKWKIGLGNNCPDPDGGHVSWWILYQQKSLPFLHFYADSRNNQEIKVTFALHDFVANLSLKLNMT